MERDINGWRHVVYNYLVPHREMQSTIGSKCCNIENLVKFPNAYMELANLLSPLVQ
jgi:hypothetical protein